MKKKNTSFTSGKKKIKLKAYKHTIAMYDVDVLLLFGDDKIKALDELYGYDSTNMAGCTMDYLNSHSECIMAFKDNPDTNVIVHECTHASFKILNYLGISFDHDNNEVFAYLTAHLVDLTKKACIMQI